VWLTSDIFIVPAAGGAIRPVVTMQGGDFHPRFSPDGKWIAFLSDGGDAKWGLYYYYYLYIAPSGGGEPQKLTAEPLCATGGMIGWSPDNREVYVQGVIRTSNRVCAVPVTGEAPRIITTGAGTCTEPAISGNGNTLAYVHQASESAPEIFLADARTGNTRKLTDVHADFPRLPLGRTEVISWKSKDGLEIEGLLTYPVGYEKGKRCPLVLNPHGGPMGSFSETFTAAGGTYPIQAFAQEGYAFLRPNPRGSNGYGRAFALANYNDWGYGDYEDIMSGVDAVVARGVAHPDSLCVMGWSYGGFMTSMVITRTKRFRAASVGAGVTNLMSFTGTSDIPSFLPDYFHGEYWDNPETYRIHSAMFNIRGVSTPTLILHGKEDVRVPFSQGQELYNALNRQGCPVQMVAYPRMGHGITEPKFIEDIGKRELEWCNKYLGRR
jgi:dipeptidyl aminopeptidase/acylaminoacyl peptidase